MKNIIKNPQVLQGMFFALLLGFIFGFDIGDDFKNLYIAKIGQLPVRYVIITVILFIDYIAFENLNHYIYIFRYKSVGSFIEKSIVIEIVITFVLVMVFHLPILVFNITAFVRSIWMILLSIINIVIIMSLILSIIRFINIWINNRITATGLFMVVFAFLDIILENISFFANMLTFNFNAMFTLPFLNSSYSLIATVLIASQIILLEVTKKLMVRKDYILKQYETSK